MPKKRPATIFARIFLPLFVVMLLQSTIFYFVTVHGRVVNALNSNAAAILAERVDNRSNELQSLFSSKWSNMDYYTDIINKLYADTVDDPAAFYANSSQKKTFLSSISGTLIAMLRNNSANGVFIVLANGADGQVLSDAPQHYYGLCVRDYDPASGYTDKEDLLVERCPSSLASQLGCSLDTYWDAFYTFSTGGNHGDFFYNPIAQAAANPGVAADNLAYFCGPHTYATGDRSVVSYSLPLISDSGAIYGVLGVELTTSNLAALLPSYELQGQGNGAYLLVQYQAGDPDFRVVAADGTLFQRCFGDVSTVALDLAPVDGLDRLFACTGKQGLALRGAISPLTIYNRNTPFEGEVLALVGLVPKTTLFSVSTEIRRSLLFVTLLVLILGFSAILLVSHFLTRPIQKLAASVQAMGPDEDAALEHINIREIDRLVDAIEEQSRQINRSKVRTEFFSRMSHDMRTPMNAIIGFSSPEVVDGCGSAQLLEYLSKINSSGKYLLGLINEVLDMTKIDSGRMELEQKPFNSRDFWAPTLSMIDELAAQHGVTFIKELPDTAGRWLLGDTQRLSQIVVNLLSNAVKFTPPGGSVTLSVTEQAQLDGCLAYQVVVRDTGVGMSREFQEKMYQPFVQEHTSRDGTGLGLSIARQLVALMGGRIQCVSAPGKGTTFTVRLTLPLASLRPAPPPAQAPAAAAPALAAVLAGKRVLLCEDHPLNQQIACRLLARQNMLVDVAENGQLGVAMFAQSDVGHYDAVLMDIRMPVMDGLHAARAIRALDRPDAGTVPILAMTANAFQEDRDATHEAGMNAHLAKPIEPQTLYRTLAEYLGGA